MKKILVSALVCAMLVPLAALSGEPAREAALKAGDIVTFGHYEQDNDPANGQEPIAWRVLAAEEGKALLLSEYNLDAIPYHKQKVTPVTWETCTLRAWLNGDFMEKAFTATEREAILVTDVKNADNPKYGPNGGGTDGGQDTKDRVFLLSIGEAENLFRDNADRRAQNSPYVKAQGAHNDGGFGWWWLRSPGGSPHIAAYVLCDGYVYLWGEYVEFDTYAVRPALWVSLDAGIF